MITPTNGAVYLVRDLRHPDWDPEPARYVASKRDDMCGLWQFFGTDDDAREEEVEVLRPMVAVATDEEIRQILERGPHSFRETGARPAPPRT